MQLTKCLNPKLIKNRYSLVDSYLRRRAIAKGFPLELAIEITNNCNAECVMCPRLKMSRDKGFMSFDLFKKIVDEARDYTEFVFLHLAGEPLLHPDLLKMIGYCKKSGINTALSTNAILLDKIKSRELINSPLDLLVLSLDSLTKETYEKIRKKSNFDNVHANIIDFLRIKSETRRSPHTVVQLIYMKENAMEVKEYIKKWEKTGVNSVRIKPYLNYPGLDNYLGQLHKRETAVSNPCILLWRQMAIYWDGSTVSCCQDFLGQSVVGDVNKNSIKEIWNSKSMVALRKLHIEGRYKEANLCKDCTVPQLSSILMLGAVLIDDLTIKKLLPSIEQLVIMKNLRKISYFT